MRWRSDEMRQGKVLESASSTSTGKDYVMKK
jgi:hypothetical protein